LEPSDVATQTVDVNGTDFGVHDSGASAAVTALPPPLRVVSVGGVRRNAHANAASSDPSSPFVGPGVAMAVGVPSTDASAYADNMVDVSSALPATIFHVLWFGVGSASVTMSYLRAMAGSWPEVLPRR
jgi:hypothetical protein